MIVTKSFALSCGMVFRRVQRSWFYFPCNLKIIYQTGPSRSNLKLKLLKIGLIPVVPSVAAQSQTTEEKSKNVSVSKVVLENRPSPKPVDDGNVSNNEDDSAWERLKAVFFKNRPSPKPVNDGNTSNDEDDAAWERLKAVFVRDDFGRPSKEMVATSQATFLAALIGAIIGGAIHSRNALHDFVDRNQATMYESTLDARKKLQNHVTIHFGKGACQWAWRLSLFTGGFMLVITSLAAYRGRSSLWDYTASGAIMGGTLRLKLGPPAILVGCITGALLGLLCGATTKGMLYLTDSNLDEVLAFQYELDRRRLELFKLAEKKHFEDTQLTPEDLITLKGQGVIKDT